ncbi:MAG: hypothetical protein KKA60_03495 [Proteobacteria bacterium]|nr:hypothetical protein [Pseudomonadota bacterium]
MTRRRGKARADSGAQADQKQGLAILLSLAVTILVLSLPFLHRLQPLWFPRGFLPNYILALVVVWAILLVAVLAQAVWIVIRRYVREKKGVGMSIWPVSFMLSMLVLTPISLKAHALLVQAGLPTGSHLRPFDPAAWRSEASTAFDQEISPREQMLKDLATNVLPGKGKGEIEGLLGPSLETEYWGGTEQADLKYFMGQERDRFISIDSEWLLIWLDESGNFQRYKIVND